jgi:uncharacterized glyoxalase superfamily protein PhnB
LPRSGWDRNREKHGGETFRSPCFGMVQDKFGVLWMIAVAE